MEREERRSGYEPNGQSLKLIPKNWAAFQHYKDRCPPWIKLHKNILDDRKYMCLPIASKALAPLLWLLASESKDGIFDASTDELVFRLRMPEKDIVSGLNSLIENGFFLDASTMQAPCVQPAPQRERQRQRQRQRTETEGESRATQMPVDFVLTDQLINYAKLKHVDHIVEFESFKNHHAAKGTTYKDWNAAWRTWIDKAVKFGNNSLRPVQKTEHQKRQDATTRALFGDNPFIQTMKTVEGEVIRDAENITRQLGR